MNDWCILRCAASRTLLLEAALKGLGIRTWVPVEILVRRHPKTRKREKHAQPILPSYVFCGFEDLPQLQRLANSPDQCFQIWDAASKRMVAKGVPFFSIFVSNGRIPRVTDKALLPLRLFERRKMPRASVHNFTVGQRVQVTSDGFEGLLAIVVGIRRGTVQVEFSNFSIAVDVDPLRLAALRMTS